MKKYLQRVITNNDGNGEKVYIYNDISAGKLQEFEVIKTNKFNVKQERMLGIDLYYIYNNIPKNKSNGIFISSLERRQRNQCEK